MALLRTLAAAVIAVSAAGAPPEEQRQALRGAAAVAAKVGSNDVASAAVDAAATEPGGGETTPSHSAAPLGAAIAPMERDDMPGAIANAALVKDVAPGIADGASALRANGATDVEAVVARVQGNASSLWVPPTIWWGSCRNYGCSRPPVWGQVCGCWPGCWVFGGCCSDYASVCPAEQPGNRHPQWPSPAPAPWPTSAPAPSPWPAPSPVVPSPWPLPSPAPTRAPAPAPVPVGPSDGKTFTFYVYRAQGVASYPPKNVNGANLAGVMWYLQHEVVTQTPPKFGITRILRYTFTTKAPAELLRQGMNFGVRYAYDSQTCTGPGNCASMYHHYGYFVGCNNFASMYPYPTEPTNYAGGIWYSFDGNGACATPTGAFDCTYSYAWPPEELSLDELTAGDAASFWADAHDDDANARKVQAAADLFAAKYPASPALSDPLCDFDYGRFWQ